MTTLHYAAGGDQSDWGTMQAAGFNLADVQYVGQLNELPSGMKGLVHLNEHNGVTQSFIDHVTPYIGNPNLFGFYLVSEPDPTGKWGPQTSASDLQAESDWIHEHVPGAKTYITLMNMGWSGSPDYSNAYDPSNTHIDYFGIDPYPVRSDSVDYGMINRDVSAAESAGISADQIVPLYQTFGGGDWTSDSGSKFILPTSGQMQEMMDRWHQLVPNPAFDYAYTWSPQRGDTTLESSPELQQVFKDHASSDSTSSTTSSDSSVSANILGDSGDNWLVGGSGDDTLYGLTGNDTLTGGGGHDTFVFTDSHGSDVIGDFQSGSDVIDLHGQTAAHSFSDLQIYDNSDGAVVRYGSGWILLWHHHASDLAAGDFVF